MMATLVMIHGMWGAGPHWAAFTKAFEAAGHTVIAPVLRHHDGDPSAAPDPALGATSLRDYADDLAAAIAKLPEKPVIIGHSMGGLLAQMLAARGLARAAIFLTPAPPSGWPAVIILFMPSVLRLFFWTILTKALFVFRPHRPSFKAACYAYLNRLEPDEQASEYAAQVHESGRVVFEIAFWCLDLKRATRVRPGDVTCPTLTVAASHDRIVPAACVRATARRYAAGGGDFVTLPENAHWVQGEANWRETVQRCLDWIAANAG
jgi:pimeloyl-ACP methyl ester carboxylesterase